MDLFYFTLDAVGSDGTTNGRRLEILFAPDPQPGNPADTRTYGVSYQKQVGNSTYYLVGFDSNSITSLNSIVGTWTFVDAGGRKQQSRWHTTDRTNIRRRWLVLRNINGNPLAGSSNLAADGWWS